MKRPTVAVLMLSFLLSTLPGCYKPGGPMPGEPVPPAERVPVPQEVIVEELAIPSPAPTDNGSPPAECDFIRFVRYRPETEGGELKPVDAVIVLMPGYMGGANEFEYMGRQLVSMAEASGRGSVEVWAIDRRPNCLEDLTGMNAAEGSEGEPDPAVAADYYFRGSEVNGRTFDGFVAEQDVPFLSEFGLRLIMEDVYTVITSLIPDPEQRRSTVFVGGHSLGTPLTGLFAGWDFDGDPQTLDDAGYRNCAGLVLLDGPVFYGDLIGFNNIDEATYLERLADIRSGAAPRFDFFTGVSPDAMALLEIIGMYAAARPDEESTLLDDVPLTEDLELLIKMLHSRDLGHFASGIPAVSDFRYTNEALLGAFMDDNFMPVKMLQASLGFLRGGAVVTKEFPGKMADTLGLGGIDQDYLFIPWDAGNPLALGTGPLYRWVNFDEVGNAARPEYKDSNGVYTYTTMLEEVTDIQDFARILYRGPSNFTEWYFSSRLRLDMGAAGAPFNSEVGLTFFHNADVDVPVIAFGAPHGDVPDISGWDAYRDSIASDEFTAIMCPGYNHLDINVAAVDRPGHRENEVFEPLLDFALRHSGGTVTPGQPN
ncbi:MAG: hypothetical protein AB1640_04455 [bacterium]